jgi:hypothetical protein
VTLSTVPPVALTAEAIDLARAHLKHIPSLAALARALRASPVQRLAVSSRSQVEAFNRFEELARVRARALLRELLDRTAIDPTSAATRVELRQTARACADVLPREAAMLTAALEAEQPPSKAAGNRQELGSFSL